MPKCKAVGCTENHATHFCRGCGNKDSDHLGRNCPKKANPGPRCAVDGCKENHTEHFCKICRNRSASHKASACPKGNLVMHVTPKSNLPGIAKSGLKPSKGGRLGPGVYFFSDDHDQQNLLEVRSKGTADPGAVLYCNVYLGNIQRIFDKDDRAGTWQQTHDSCQARHPPWAHHSDKPFSEWCIKDEKRCKILKVEIPAENKKYPWNEYIANHI